VAFCHSVIGLELRFRSNRKKNGGSSFVSDAFSWGAEPENPLRWITAFKSDGRRDRLTSCGRWTQGRFVHESPIRGGGGGGEKSPVDGEGDDADLHVQSRPFRRAALPILAGDRRHQALRFSAPGRRLNDCTKYLVSRAMMMAAWKHLGRQCALAEKRGAASTRCDSTPFIVCIKGPKNLGCVAKLEYRCPTPRSGNQNDLVVVLPHGSRTGI